MQKVIAFTVVAVLLVLGTAAPLAADDENPAKGAFTAVIDFDSFEFKDIGPNCRLKKNGTLFFQGTLCGQAVGTTRALVFGPCESVRNSLPGTFADEFWSDLQFEGTVNGTPVTADITYSGVTETGGAITAGIHLSNGMVGSLDVDAIAALGGDYEGFVLLDDSD